MVIYCFLGFTGKRTKRYSGFSALIRALEARGYICRIFEHEDGISAAQNYCLYDKGEEVSVIGHSLGADAGREFCGEISKIGYVPRVYVAMDFIPHSIGKHILAFLSHLIDSVMPSSEVFHTKLAKTVVHFYQRKFNLWKPGTWPHGRLLVNEQGKMHMNIFTPESDHCSIDANRFVWEQIFQYLSSVEDT